MQPEEQSVLIELKEINGRLKRQNSLWHMLLAGLVYGIGFFIGSAIIATILIGIFAPIVSEIPWIQTVFTAGSQFRAH